MKHIREYLTVLGVIMLSGMASAVFYDISGTGSTGAGWPGNVTGMAPWLFISSPGNMSFNSTALPAAVAFDPVNQDRNITELWAQGNANTASLTEANTTANNAAANAASVKAALELNASKYDAYMADNSAKMTANDSLKVNKAGDTMTGDLLGTQFIGTLNTTADGNGIIIKNDRIYLGDRQATFRVELGNKSVANYIAFMLLYNASTYYSFSPEFGAGKGLFFRTDGTNLQKRFLPYDNNAYDLGIASAQWGEVWARYTTNNDTFGRAGAELVRTVETPEGQVTQFIPWPDVNNACGTDDPSLSCWANYGNQRWNTTKKITKTYDGGLLYEGELLTNSKGYKKGNKTLKNVVASVTVKADGQIDHAAIDPSLTKNGHISIDARIGALEQLLTQVVNESCADSKNKYTYCQ